MTIGEALKKKRQELGLSQTEMAAGVLTKSYYSKVERGLHEIKAVDLLEILAIHHVNANEFLDSVKNGEEKEFQDNQIKRFLAQIRDAYYHKDLAQIIEIRKMLRKVQPSDDLLKLDALTELIEANFRHQFFQIPDSEKKRIKKLIFKTEKWDLSSLRLLSMSLPLFKMKEMDPVISSIFNKHLNTKGLSGEQQERIAALAINYLEWAYR